MTDGELIVSFLDGIRQDAIADLKSKNISNSDLGMAVEASETEGALTGYSYWYFLVHGRAPGKQPPPESIIGWIKRKGIESVLNINSLAYLIGRKIGRLGTDIYLGKRPGLALEEIFEKREEKFIEDLKANKLTDINMTIKSLFQQALSPN
jgi:hypothetical protein